MLCPAGLLSHLAQLRYPTCMNCNPRRKEGADLAGDSQLQIIAIRESGPWHCNSDSTLKSRSSRRKEAPTVQVTNKHQSLFLLYS
jgi:hypothetical protein